MESKVLEYMRRKGYMVDTEPGCLNIVYLEGINSDFTPNRDEFDGWNDLSLIIDHDADGVPKILFSAVCTTEPGRASTMAPAAAMMGGVARIAFGQYRAWRVGYHKRSRLLDTHPALVQCAEVPVHRDVNRDGKRTGDPMGTGYGINQHGTKQLYSGKSVGAWSAGCLVRRLWSDHETFMGFVKTDLRYQDDTRYIFYTTVIAGDDFLRIFGSENEMKAPA